jgi:hypothetical protein
MNIYPQDYKCERGGATLASPRLLGSGLQVGFPTTTLFNIHFYVRIRSRALV